MDHENHLTIRRADETDTHTIRILAHAVWPGTYGNILSEPQLQYMLDLFYSERSLVEQMRAHHTFFIAEINSEPVGFASFSHDHTSHAYKIHKLYVHPMMQGKGIGRKLIDRVIEAVRRENGSVLRLNVNRYNNARSFYERMGFNVVGDEDIAIGEGYFMNDYIMEKRIS